MDERAFPGGPSDSTVGALPFGTPGAAPVPQSDLYQAHVLSQQPLVRRRKSPWRRVGKILLALIVVGGLVAGAFALGNLLGSGNDDEAPNATWSRQRSTSGLFQVDMPPTKNQKRQVITRIGAITTSMLVADRRAFDLGSGEVELTVAAASDPLVFAESGLDLLGQDVSAIELEPIALGAGETVEGTARRSGDAIAVLARVRMLPTRIAVFVAAGPSGNRDDMRSEFDRMVASVSVNG
jgi:hypothetical protein